MRWLMVPLVVLCWWNRTAMVDGVDNRIDDVTDVGSKCSLVTLPYSVPPCEVAVAYRGEFPAWLRSRDLTGDIFALPYEDLKRAAQEQICPCHWLGVSPLCPTTVKRAFGRIVQLCTNNIELLSFPRWL
ncbi:uncharacterized protein LOC108667523 [Hyalella azteca]|uniref:Uncharacterized protein LOC108667523 n=1 Tax=Hyalella azteca TaxID=294128 RepID=A0A979FWR7_HYAAZ|nr:uncharacterized protein LOC108667523 [Hyalella azteca]